MSSQSDSFYALLAAVLGSVGTLLLSSLLEWLRKPVLLVSLDLSALTPLEAKAARDLYGKYTVTPVTLGQTKWIRLKVHNKGHRAAYRCEAKIEPMDKNGRPLFDPSILHWVRNYPAVCPNPEDQFKPVVINCNDHELLDAFYLVRQPASAKLKIESDGVKHHIVDTGLEVQTAAHRPYPLKSNMEYRLKVTVFGENAEPKAVTLRFFWDGTWNGFNKRCVGIV